MRKRLVGTRMFRRGAPDLATLSERVRLCQVVREVFAGADAFLLALRLVGLAVLEARLVALEGK